ncbi:MAG: MarR family transcriptional regulator [Longimicrobiales bacterium]
MTPERDFVDHLVAQWSEARPDLDAEPMGVAARIMRVGVLLERRLAALLEPHGLSIWEFDVLATLRRNDPAGLPPKRLLQEMLLSSGAMTHRIDRLVASGWVERHPDPADRRSVLVRLTDAGRAVVDPAVADRLADARAVADLLPPSQTAPMVEALRRLALTLQDESW